MSSELAKIDGILQQAAREGRSSLFEYEVYRMLAAVGLTTRHTVLLPVHETPNFAEATTLAADRLVLKAMSPILAHKSDVGGVQFVEATEAAVKAGYEKMLAAMPGAFRGLLERGMARPKGYEDLSGEAIEQRFMQDLQGILVCDFVAYDQPAMGGELFMGLRWTREFGYIVSAGAGGLDTELLAGVMKPPYGVAIAAAELSTPQEFLSLFSKTLVFRKATGLTRGQQRLIDDQAFAEVYAAFQRLAAYFSDDRKTLKVLEFEVNPFVISEGRLVAVDGLCNFGVTEPAAPPRPVDKIKLLLEPRTIGVFGVSGKSVNVGRIILRNILNEGFPPENIFVVKPEEDCIDGVKCYPTMADIPGKLDLAVVSVSAPQIPDLVDEVVANENIETLILIPGGMGEKSGGENLERRIRSALSASRATPWRGPLLNGGNCLGIQSRPGRYDTLFIPKNKLPAPKVPVGKVALVSQSGAYMITRISNLQRLNPVVSISTGNQIDVTVSDYLGYFVDDYRAEVIAVYVEGFQNQDGREFARLTRKAVAAGKDVILYKAGRTPEGKQATSGHTASIAGDYPVCEAVMIEAGAMVAHTFDEFGALIRTAACLRGRRLDGWRLGAISNAGYETVGMADNIAGADYQFSFAGLAPATKSRIQQALATSRIDALVDIRNPLDLTPMANEAIYEETIRAMLDDPNVDAMIVGIVPLTAALATLAANDSESKLIASLQSLAHRLPVIFSQTVKPMLVVVDSGPLYDPMADMMESLNVPTFRSADLALRILGRWASNQLKRNKK